MVYLDNDFYSTLVGNQKNGKKEEVKSQILNEVADLIAYHKAEVIEALNASGISTNSNASDKTVINALVDNVEKNKKLQAGIGYLITKKQVSESQSGDDGSTSSGGGLLGNLLGNSAGGAGVSGAAQGAAGGAGAGPIGAIVGAVAGAVGSVFSYKAAQTNAKAQADAQRMQLAQMVLDRKGGGSNKAIYIGLGLIALVAIVIVVMKRKK